MKIIVGVEQDPRVQFTIEVGEAVPDLIKLNDGSLLVLGGKYASPGERWKYNRVGRVLDAAGVETKPWQQYTKLEG